MNTIRRLFAFVFGQQVEAEGLEYEKCGEMPPWIVRAAADEQLSTFALEAARRSAEWADDAVKQLQVKASAFLTVILVLIPLGLAVTSLGLPPTAPVIARVVSFGVLVLGDVLLIVAALMAGLASGLVMTSGTNVARLEKPQNAFDKFPAAAQLSALRAAEAHAWECSAWISMQAATRVGFDLFQARRFVVIASILFAVGIVVLVLSVNGDVGALAGQAPTPAPSPPKK